MVHHFCVSDHAGRNQDIFGRVADGLKRGLMLSVSIKGTLQEEELQNGLAGHHAYTVQVLGPSGCTASVAISIARR